MHIRVAILIAAALCLVTAGCSQSDTGSVWRIGADIDAGDVGGTDDGSDALDSEVETPDVVDPDPDVADVMETDGDGGGCAAQGVDCDYDGLTDCEEERLGTDPCEVDTDGDGLIDSRELEEETDPLKGDTDGDGLGDDHEHTLGLDPLKTDTYDDGTIDSERWVASACESVEPEWIDYYHSKLVAIGSGQPQVDVGNWRLALPAGFRNYVELDIDGLAMTGGTIDNRKAAALYDHGREEVSGFLLSQTPLSSMSTPTRVLQSHRQAVSAVGTLEQELSTGEFDTHDFRKAASARFLITEVATDTNGMSTKELREHLLFEMGPFEPGEARGLPETNGTKYTSFRVNISVIYRQYANGVRHILTSVGVAPAVNFASRTSTRRRLEWITDTTHVEEAVTSSRSHCDIFQPIAAPKLDVYWVFEHAGSMSDDYERVQDTAIAFHETLTAAGVDFRFGVTSADNERRGRLDSQVGWHRDLETFQSQIDAVSNTEPGQFRRGLDGAKDGLSYMLGLDGASPPANQKVRDGAKVVTVFVSDTEDGAFFSSGFGTTANQDRIGDLKIFFGRYSRVFALLGDNAGCGVRRGEAYEAVVEATGGSRGSLCATNLAETMAALATRAAGSTAQYRLRDAPIASSLRVWVDGRWVPRSRENGYEYFPESKSLVFYGSFRPQLNLGAEPDFLSVHYEMFLDARH